MGNTVRGIRDSRYYTMGFNKTYDLEKLKVYVNKNSSINTINGTKYSTGFDRSDFLDHFHHKPENYLAKIIDDYHFVPALIELEEILKKSPIADKVVHFRVESFSVTYNRTVGSTGIIIIEMPPGKYMMNGFQDPIYLPWHYLELSIGLSFPHSAPDKVLHSLASFSVNAGFHFLNGIGKVRTEAVYFSKNRITKYDSTSRTTLISPWFPNFYYSGGNNAWIERRPALCHNDERFGFTCRPIKSSLTNEKSKKFKIAINGKGARTKLSSVLYESLVNNAGLFYSARFNGDNYESIASGSTAFADLKLKDKSIRLTTSSLAPIRIPEVVNATVVKNYKASELGRTYRAGKVLFTPYGNL
jgi:hypothetical protein